jgi:hypothetical protein
MRACSDRGIWRVVRGWGLTGAATSSLRIGAGDEIGRTRGIRAGRSADGAGSEADGSTARGFGVKSASAVWRSLAIGSRSSPRRWCGCCRWLSKGCPDCFATRDIEVEFVSFYKSLPQMLDATSTSKSTKTHKAHYGKFPTLGERSFTFVFCDVVFSIEKGRT